MIRLYFVTGLAHNTYTQIQTLDGRTGGHPNDRLLAAAGPLTASSTRVQTNFLSIIRAAR